MLALLMTRELTFKTIEDSMEGPDGPMPSHCILHSPVLATSRGRLEGGWQISVQESCTNSLGLSVFNGESGVELEGSLAVQTLGNILLGVLVLIGTRKKVDMPGDGGQGRRGLQASPPLLLPLLGDFQSMLAVLGESESVGGESGSFECVSFYQLVQTGASYSGYSFDKMFFVFPSVEACPAFYALLSGVSWK